MSTETLTLKIPAALAQGLESASREFLIERLELGLHQLKIESALDRYCRGRISFGAAAHRVGVPEFELARHAYARGMEPLVSAETLAEALS
jgi:hypothetical protein